MDTERAERLVSELRARRVMAHLNRVGVYESGIRVVLDTNLEALWNVDGAAGLDAEILNNGTLVGYVPHIPGSESFTDAQIVEHIATTRYSLDGLHPPADGDRRNRPATPPPPAPPAPDAGQPRHWTERFRSGRRGRH